MSNGHLSILEVLHRWQCQLDVQNRNGCTPLHLAVEGNNLQLVKWLIEHGASTLARDNRLLTAEELAQRKGCHDISNYLHQHTTVSEISLD